MMPPPLDVPGLPRQGDTVAGKYQIESILGRGGMGVVMAALHLPLRRRVAIKFLLPGSGRMRGAHERFLREGRAAAALESEHVARVLDVGVLDNGTPYLVMEHLSGSDLGTVLRARGRLPVPEAVDIILQACAAIGEAHALGIVHRDLKPQNIFLAERTVSVPVVKVLDFGLARNPEDDRDENGERLTTTSLVVGTPYYMSPEQLQSLKYVDARTDIWALGVILYEMIAGHRPFEGPSISWVYDGIRSRPPLPLQLCRRGVPPGLDMQILRCLEKDPAWRVQSVPELVQGLLPYAPQKSGFSAAHLPGTGANSPSGAPPAPSRPPGASVAPVTSSITVREQATITVNTTVEPRSKARPRRAPLLAATGAGAAVLLAGGALLCVKLPSLRDVVEPRVAASTEPPVATMDATATAAPPVEQMPAPSGAPPASANAPLPTCGRTSASSTPPGGASAPPPVKPRAPRLPAGTGAAPAQSAAPAGEEMEKITPKSDVEDPWRETPAGR